MGRRARAVMAALAMGTICLTAALAPALGNAAGGETPVTVAVGDEAPADFDFGFAPALLPGSDPGATRLRLGVEENPSFFRGGVPPGIKEARFGLDHSIHLEPYGPPVCRLPAIESGIQVEPAGPNDCPQAVVGRAEAKIWVAFPESVPIKVPTRGTVYNGGTRGGVTDLLVELPVPMPIVGTLQILVPVRPVRRGRIDSEAIFTAPVVAQGYGTFQNLQLDLERGFTENGERGGYVSAECRDGKLTATLAASFTDGTTYSQESIRACASAKR